VVVLCDPEDERDAPEVRAARLDKDAVLDPMANDDVAISAIERLGANDGAEALALVRALRAGPDSALNAKGTPREGAQRLLFACLQSGDSERALSRMVSFAAGRPAHFTVWRLLARDEHQRTVRLLADLFSLNDSLSQGLLGFPHARGRVEDTSFTFLIEASLDAPLTPRQIGEHFDAAMKPLHEQCPADEVDAVLNHTRHRVLTQMALHDLAHQPPAEEIGARLADLADEVLRRMLEDQVRRYNAAHGSRGDSFDLAVLALGKLGMRFMDFGSDLDLVFVFRPRDPDTASARDVRQDATRIGIEMMSRLRNRAGGTRLYDVDTRLRPSGRQGLLVSSGEAFSRYQRGSLPVWERLASLWIRPITAASFGAGSAPSSTGRGVAAWADELCREAKDAIVSATFEPEQLTTDTQQILGRIAAEVSRETRTTRPPIEAMRDTLHKIDAGEAPDITLDAKLGAGACLDFELTAGALFLRHRDRWLADEDNTPSDICAMIDALHTMAVIDGQEASKMHSAYGFLRKLLNRLRMDAYKLGDGSADSFALNSPRLPRVARRMGIEDETALVRQFLEHRIAVRSILNERLLRR
jgi:glutamate-ammonia-ligase adenylyltransferase